MASVSPSNVICGILDRCWLQWKVQTGNWKARLIELYDRHLPNDKSNLKVGKELFEYALVYSSAVK